MRSCCLAGTTSDRPLEPHLVGSRMTYASVSQPMAGELGIDQDGERLLSKRKAAACVIEGCF